MLESLSNHVSYQLVTQQQADQPAKYLQQNHCVLHVATTFSLGIQRQPCDIGVQGYHFGSSDPGQSTPTPS